MRRLLAGIFRRRWNSSNWGNWGFSTGAALSASLFVASDPLSLPSPPAFVELSLIPSGFVFGTDEGEKSCHCGMGKEVPVGKEGTSSG